MSEALLSIENVALRQIITTRDAEIARLRAALEEIANSTWVAQTCPEAVQIARAALANAERK